jgi:hypothetical protein
MAEPVTQGTLSGDDAARLADFARACKAAARAVSLYPGAHPAIATTLSRLAEVTARLTEAGTYRLQVFSDKLLVDGAGMPKPDAAVTELADLLHRHLIGGLNLNAGADAGSWRTLLLLLARSPEEVRADGGIARLWATAGGPNIEIQEVDYAEVLREKAGLAASIEEIVAAALAGRHLELDDSAMQMLLEIVGDPAKLDALMKQLDEATAQKGVDAKTAAFLNLLRGLAEYASRHDPTRLDSIFRNMSHAAGRLSADGMLSLLAQRGRPEAVSGEINVAGAVIERMTDQSVVQFVSGSVIAEGGASERLATAFQALVPDTDRQRRLIGVAEQQVAETDLGKEETFAELWQRVETMLTSYTDADFVSREYGRELGAARSQAVEVDRTSDDPPERVSAWIATVNDSALRSLDERLLLDLLVIEQDPLRWRDIADTAITHADDLVRVGHFDSAWDLAEAVAGEGAKDDQRKPFASAALDRFGRGVLMKHVAAHLRNASDGAYARFQRLCQAIGPAIIAPLAEVLSAEQDARSRRRLRDILVGFGAQGRGVDAQKGREIIQQLMNASNWEVRRTAAYILREFGGSEGLQGLVPLLTDAEPLVQREAIEGLIRSGTDDAAAILLKVLSSASGRARETLVKELVGVRDERAAPLFCYLLRHVDRRALPRVYVGAIDALGAFGGPEAVEALKFALHQGDWKAPFETRRLRAAAAQALRKVGTPAAIDVLRDCSTRGPRGVRAAARTELARLSGR